VTILAVTLIAGATASVGHATVAYRPLSAGAAITAHVTIDGSKYMQLITSSPGCWNTISVTRYDASGNVAGSKTIVRGSGNVQLVPRDYSATYGQRTQRFLFESFNCDTDVQRLYSINLGSATAKPSLVMTGDDRHFIYDAKIDLATDRVLVLVHDDQGTRVDNVTLSGHGRKTVWRSAQSAFRDVGFSYIVPKTGGEFLLAGNKGDGWEAIRLSDFDGALWEQQERVGNGSLWAARGGVIELGDVTVFVTQDTHGWLCRDGGTSTAVTTSGCLAFAAPSLLLPGYPAVTFGGPTGAGFTLAWSSCPGLCVQRATASPGRPVLGSLTRVYSGPAARSLDIVDATNFTFAVDRTAPTVRVK